jgi:glycosyltransferase involved in cell wall biosynthesis
MATAFLVVSVRHLRRPYDVVHVHNVPDFLVFCALVPRLFGARVILDIHDALPELYAGKFGVSSTSSAFRALLLLERYSCRFAHSVIVANHIWHARLVERASVGGKSATLLNYPDLTIFRPKPGRSAPAAPFRVVYPGSLSRHQGVDIAVKAFAAVHPQLGDAEFHIYGEGPAKQELLDLSRALGMSDHITLHDPLPVDQVGTLMAGATVGVEPKLALGFSGEALSTKILEFMATGTPVIVSRTLAHEFYFPPDLVRFFPSGDVAALGAAFVEARSQPPDEATALRLRTFAATYGWEHRVADYFRLIDASPQSVH